MFKTDESCGLECFVNVDFASDWSKENSDVSENVLSCTGFVTFYVGYLLV